MIAALGATVALTFTPAPADTDTEPIDAAIIELFVQTADAVPLCESYSAVIAAIGDLGVGSDAGAVFVDAADAYLIVAVEGDSLRLTPEARGVLVDWLHAECTAP